MTDKRKTLLPKGFHDVLPPMAATESKIMAKLLKSFEQWGYEQVRPPMVEFEVGADTQTFQVMDPASRKMMCIRDDMTPQVARMVVARFENTPRPLRLSYAGEVLRANGEGLHAERQLAQAGIELIGVDEIGADAEAVLLAVESLGKLKLDKLSVDFSMPRLSQWILADTKTSVSEYANILESIEKKDKAAIEKTGHEAASLLVSLVSSAGPASKVVETLQTMDLPEQGKVLCDRLAQLVSIISSEAPNLNMTIDPLELKGFEYYSGVSFSFFAKGSTEELGRGGHYLINETNEEAVGFTLSVNALQRVMPIRQKDKRVLVPAEITLEESKKLRDEGYVTVHVFSGDVDNNAAEVQNCDFVYKNGRIESL